MSITIIVEDGCGLENTNSYISLEDADAYFDTRINSSVWLAATDDGKSRALITATNGLDSYLTFTGYLFDTYQAHAFSRLYRESHFNLNNTEVLFPTRQLESATCEYALSLLSSDLFVKNDPSTISKVSPYAEDAKFTNYLDFFNYRGNVVQNIRK